MLTVAERKRKQRARQRAGRAMLCIEVDEIALIDALIVARFLPRAQADDPMAVIAAVQKLIEDFSKGQTE
jgi:hypothetical protein